MSDPDIELKIRRLEQARADWEVGGSAVGKAGLELKAAVAEHLSTLSPQDKAGGE